MSTEREPAVTAENVTFKYGRKTACDGISFTVRQGDMHAFLGPNGSGKSTLFKILSTAYPPQQGSVSILGFDLASDMAKIRPLLGVVFQSPSLDKHLTVRENLVCGGHLFGLRGEELTERVDQMLANAGLADRAGERVSGLSGGLRRRTEIAKGLLPRPKIVLLDEPSTGLDPAIRHDLWRFLRSLDDVTILFTTHLMDEGEQADHVTIMRAGHLVADGRPADMVSEFGDQVLELTCDDPYDLAPRINETLGIEAVPVERVLRIESENAYQLVPRLVEAFGAAIKRLTFSPPSLEDVYIRMTGHHFLSDVESDGGNDDN